MTENPPDEAAALRQEIEQTRVELADTVDALSDKLNVKKQAAQKVDRVKTTVADKAGDARSTAARHQRELAIGAAVAAAVVAIVLVIRRRSR